MHDYFTLCSLSALAVLWSLRQTSIELGFHDLGSTFSAIRRIFFDFSVAQTAFQSFAKKASDEETLGQPVTDETATLVWNLARPSFPLRWSISNWIWIVALILLIILSPYLVPFLMMLRDRADINRAIALFETRRFELTQATVEDEIREAISSVFERQTSSFLNFQEINALYYRKVIKHQGWYYCAVFALFGLFVFVNYAWVRAASLAS